MPVKAFKHKYSAQICLSSSTTSTTIIFNTQEVNMRSTIQFIFAAALLSVKVASAPVALAGKFKAKKPLKV